VSRARLALPVLLVSSADRLLLAGLLQLLTTVVLILGLTWHSGVLLLSAPRDERRWPERKDERRWRGRQLNSGRVDWQRT
jgi:hypothetical protein